MDTLSKDTAVERRLEMEREQLKGRIVQHPMSRTSSQAKSHRGEQRSPGTSTAPTSPKVEPTRTSTANASVRPSFSFANAAASRKDAFADNDKDAAEVLADKMDEVAI